MTKTSKRILLPTFQTSVISKVTDEFNDYVEDLFIEFDESYAKNFFSDEFQRVINGIISDDQLFHYSPLKFYFTKQVEDGLFLAHLHHELQTDLEVEEEIFDFWKDSDFSETFLELNQEAQGEQIEETSKKLKHLLENQILSFYFIHISTSPESQPGTLTYSIQPNLGDNTDCIYISEKHLIGRKTGIFKDGILPVHMVTNMRMSLEIEVDGEIDSFPLLPNPFSIKLDEKIIHVNPGSPELYEKAEGLVKDFERALSNIKKASPDCYQCFCHFTNVIVPVSEGGIVSYSMQSLPGYSSVNVTERTFLDMHDDLIHESGHHFLNTILNAEELIKEDDDQIYYSPWRRAKRPIRGIYHAYFTFYWAFKLFSDFLKSAEKGILLDGLNGTNQAQIRKRCVEEYIMLNFCYSDLINAFKSGKVTEEGISLIEEINNELDENKAFITEHRNLLPSEHLDEMKNLEEILKKERNQAAL